MLHLPTEHEIFATVSYAAFAGVAIRLFAADTLAILVEIILRCRTTKQKIKSPLSLE